jgi:uncharacterized protein with FMN-binding domain
MSTSHTPRKPASNQRLSHGLTAVGSAAVLAIYAAGYSRTKSASDRLSASALERRAAAPLEIRTPAPPAPVPELSLPTSPRPAPPQKAEAPPLSTPAPTDPAPPRPAAERPAASAVSTLTTSSSATAAATASIPVDPSHQDGAAVMSSNPPAAVEQATAMAETASSTASSAPAASPAGAVYKDGTYTGWGTCRHGDIQATVVIAGGKIASAEISQCLTRYSCSWIAPLPGQVVTRQSPNVDYVSGATQSTDAYYGAVVDALYKAK